LWRHIGGLPHPSTISEADHALWKVLFSAMQGGDLLEELSTTLEDLSAKVHADAPAWIDVVTVLSWKQKCNNVESSSSEPLPGLTGIDMAYLSPPTLLDFSMDSYMSDYGTLPISHMPSDILSTFGLIPSTSLFGANSFSVNSYFGSVSADRWLPAPLSSVPVD
ncbi:hypothetical protein C0989_008937, partial [Termitomyces sp. Mn162]